VTPVPGRLIALEGVDGSGKSTQARILARSLGALLTFEPGATELGRALRRLLLEPGGPAPDLRAEALLVAADRAQHVAQVIRPALDEGRVVVTDRYSGSTLAYQGYGRGLPVGELRGLVEWASCGIRPDLSVVLDIAPDEARSRIQHQSADRLERLDVGFFSRVRDGYLELARQDPDHWAVVDGGGDVDTVARSVRQVVAHRIERALVEDRRA